MSIDTRLYRSRNDMRKTGACYDCKHAHDDSSAVTDIDELIAEVERLSRECPKCHYKFLYRSGLDRHPCPPPPDYNFGAP